MKNLLLAVVALLIPVLGMSQRQMRLWTFPPERYDFGSSAMSNLPTPSAPPGDAYDGARDQPSNCWYDESGRLIAFIAADRDGILSLFDGNGFFWDWIGFAQGYLPTGSYRCDEVSIIPVPGVCNEYFIIYDVMLRGGNPVGDASHVEWMRVSLVPSNPGEPFSYQLLTFGIVDGPVEASCATAGFAISPILNGNHHLVYVNTCAFVFRFTLSAAGLLPDVTFNSPLNVVNLPCMGSLISVMESELFVGEEQSIYACGCNGTSGQYQVNLIYINQSSQYSSTRVVPLGAGGFTPGIEFSESGDYLFLTHYHPTGGGAIGPLGYVDLNHFPLAAANLTVPFGVTAADYATSFIEIAQDHSLYFANATKADRMHDPENLVSAWTLGAFPIQSDGVVEDMDVTFGTNNVSFRVLPDQLDGQDYRDIMLPVTQMYSMLRARSHGLRDLIPSAQMEEAR